MQGAGVGRRVHSTTGSHLFEQHLVGEDQRNPGADGVAIDVHAVAFESHGDPSILRAELVAEEEVRTPSARVASADQKIHVPVAIEIGPGMILGVLPSDRDPRRPSRTSCRDSWRDRVARRCRCPRWRRPRLPR